ncbi:hypothetical protein CYLTODRAFT_450655 [Cylindrobasidium torrendii FP15055 ss-10]|uniref:Uncharacterized protein n=1 Tax=Cylindrobasidium torrendii FP15055 ss-10 TaxID=1314674 RepID=A0A0D7BN92_9AGAR|nr:hypothetical protein CYLTODRAFT_450655 [Cylindrobasidium torrendii FP15055 ss-10]
MSSQTNTSDIHQPSPTTTSTTTSVMEDAAHSPMIFAFLCIGLVAVGTMAIVAWKRYRRGAWSPWAHVLDGEGSLVAEEEMRRRKPHLWEFWVDSARRHHHKEGRHLEYEHAKPVYATPYQVWHGHEKHGTSPPPEDKKMAGEVQAAFLLAMPGQNRSSEKAEEERLEYCLGICTERVNQPR